MAGINECDLKELFGTVKRIAVVGLSSNPSRPSYHVAEYLQKAGYRIVPVNPSVHEVLGEKSYPSITAVPGQIDLVDVFRNPDEVMPAVDETLASGAPYLWLQEGVVNMQAAEKAAAGGVSVVMDRCILKEHLRIERQRTVEAAE